jgi:murein DD-endopeptidase MepM/ murein hydrolase activator NlpD
MRRTVGVPAGHTMAPAAKINTYHLTYVGYVKSHEDPTRMGKIQVWIPEFSASAEDANAWVSVAYCSPFAGASPSANNVKDGTTMADSQVSYGWWAVPPDIDNEVVVQFINGDPNRGIWIGCLYQQYMNNMVPGIPTGQAHQEGQDGAEPPTTEYNKWASDVSPEAPTRPRYDPLHDALSNQGLYEDSERGGSNASARRAAVSGVYGFLSPQGTGWYIDDSEESGHMRMRTRNGTQVLINNASGYVYINSGNGNAWFQVSDDGIDMYSANGVNIRAQGDMNFHSDANINMYAKGAFNAYGGAGSTLQFGTNANILVGEDFNLSVNGDGNLLFNGSSKISTKGDHSLNAEGFIAQKSGGASGYVAGANMHVKGSQLITQAAPGPTPAAASEAQAAQPGDLQDQDLAGGGEMTTRSIVSRMPTHEPWGGHPSGPSGPIRRPHDPSVSTPNVYDGNSARAGSAGRNVTEDATPVPENTTWIVPASGRVSSRYGPRSGGFHSGVDIAAPIGTSIYAAAAGTIIKAGPATGYGQAVYVDHGNGWITEYGHVNTINVRRGARVTQGQLIATVGNRGRSTGPHLHLTFRSSGSRGHRNPQTFIAGLAAGTVRAKTR